MAILKPDCIVADSMALWGKAVALKLGIPFVSSTTTFAFNQHSAKIMHQGLKELLKMIFSMPKTAKQVGRLKGNGYPVNSILDIIGSDENTHTIVYTSRQFQPCAETFSNKYEFVGPSVRIATEKIEKNRDKLVYISMGTVNNRMKSFYKTCISALANTKYQVIMSVGDSFSADDLGEIPENISVHKYVDQIAVLEQADVFISHCGMNSVSEILYFGVPLIMFPQTTEQKGVAERVLKLGAGINLGKINKQSVLSTINLILSDNTYREKVKGIADEFKRCSGAKGAADKILKVCAEID